MSTSVSIAMTQKQDYQFTVDFGPGTAALLADEPPPLGKGEGPAPTQLLLAAVGNCLSASLLFALRKFRQDGGALSAQVNGTVGRNPENRLRVQSIEALLRLGRRGEEIEHLDRILGQFEEFCTVTQSVRGGIPVTVTVTDSEGRRLK